MMTRRAGKAGRGIMKRHEVNMQWHMITTVTVMFQVHKYVKTYISSI